MKIVLVALVMVPFFASAQVSTNSMSSCSSWNYNSASGGYVCSSYPMTAWVPDSNSLNNKIRQLEARITALEEKIQQITEAN